MADIVKHVFCVAPDNATMTVLRTWIAAIAAVSGAACSPALDWREFVPEGLEVSVTFPCRPDRQSRGVVVAGITAPMDMMACAAGEATFALSVLEVADPSRTSAVLADLRAKAIANVQGFAPQLAPVQIQGMTPNGQAMRLSVAGRLPDGAVVQLDAVFFTRGLRVYQATVIGRRPSPSAIDTFLGGLRFPV